jgi:hypothetical protein
MTTTFAAAKEEADKIYHDMLWIFEQEPIDKSTARACSIVAVDKIIEALKLNEWQNKKEIFYYEEVKRQIIFYI